MKERIRRYKDKMSYIVRNMEAVELQPESELELSDVFYKLHTSIEVAMDIASMLLKDMGENVGNDYTTLYHFPVIFQTRINSGLTRI